MTPALVGGYTKTAAASPCVGPLPYLPGRFHRITSETCSRSGFGSYSGQSARGTKRGCARRCLEPESGRGDRPAAIAHTTTGAAGKGPATPAVGVDLQNIVTRGTLQGGLAYALAQPGVRGMLATSKAEGAGSELRESPPAGDLRRGSPFRARTGSPSRPVSPRAPARPATSSRRRGCRCRACRMRGRRGAARSSPRCVGRRRSRGWSCRPRRAAAPPSREP